ncbi:replication protein A 70 kDa DNA-binding subunit-like isoform X2 [Belonocnema kinseyi]|uniref:replication protein A 70 kDa DNA-binding subunit-like isoform X2 n=1 Tax=Belonocnema kinseyi TaxID=2817044 RepID=UPI00143DF5A5|nr:replication protein A 70 kDa DNA-binding subunit-like isoform X2 [Belonocnema kinseyi]
MEQRLSAGSLLKIFDGELTEEPIVVQYLGHKLLSGNRYRLILSDGETSSSFTVLSLQNNRLVTDGALSPFAICRISKYLLATAKTASVWTIKARVTSKTDIRHWSNVRGVGKLFSMDLIDESAEIRCTGFKEQCDVFYDSFEVGRIYYITRCQVKPADKRFTNIKHDFELVLNSDTAILNCEEDSRIPMIQFDFLSLDNVETKDNESIMDVLAVVKSVSDVVNLKAKTTGRDLKKRDIHLVDLSNTMVILTLWGTQAEIFDGSNNPVIAVKSVKITEFNGGRSLTSTSSTIIQFNPDIVEAHSLLEWFHESVQARDARLLSTPSASSSNANCPWLTLRQVKDLNIGSPGNPNMFLTKATVNLIRDRNCIYRACPTEGCKKKLSDLNNGMYNCEKCQTGFPNYVYRMIVQAVIVDWTGEQKVAVFGDEAEKIVGVNAQELGQLQETLNIDAYQKIFLDCAFKSFIFKIRMKQETFNDETKLKAVVYNVTPVDQKQYGSFLVSQIKALLKKRNPP